MIAWAAVLWLAQIELPLDLPKLKALAAEVRRGDAPAPRQKLLDLAERALAHGDPLSAAYAQAGLVLFYEATNRPNLAEAAWRESATDEVRRRDPYFAPRTAWWIALEAGTMGRAPRARRWRERAIEESRSAGDSETLAQALRMASSQVAGRQRLDLLAEAAQAARSAADPRLHALIQIDWGEALRAAGDLAGAITQLQQASATLRKIEAPAEAGRALNALALAYAVHGRYREALAELRLAEKLLAGAEHADGLARTRVEIANMFAALGQRERALPLLRQAEKDVPREDRPLATLLAHGYFGAGDYRKAAEIAEPLMQGTLRRRPTAAHWILAAAWFHLGRYADSITVATAAIEATDQPEALVNISALRWRARSLDRLGRHAEAARDMRDVTRLGESVLLRAAPADEMRVAFTDRLEEIAADVIAVLWRAGAQREALETAERFRARAFLDLVASRDGAPASEWFVPLDRVVAHVHASGEAILSYWVHPERLYLWLVTPAGEIRAQQVDVSEERLRALVAQARRLNYQSDRAAWRELHRLLIQPVASALPPGAAITVLPHGPLLQLPFAALLAPAGRYLVEDHRLRVTPAVALLLRAHPAGARGPALLAGAPVRSGLAPLPGAQRELRSVEGILVGEKRLFGGPRLLVAALHGEAPGARLLHFATHAVIDEREPLQSYLALSDGGRLTTEAVYGWRLQADLVMLSACRGASGRVAADGLLGFPRAFLYAGAASVIAPLADIPDETTVRLVEEFYRGYARGQSKADSLRAAQLLLLAGLRAGEIIVETPAGKMALPEHPGFWAPFVLMGED